MGVAGFIDSQPVRIEFNIKWKIRANFIKALSFNNKKDLEVSNDFIGAIMGKIDSKESPMELYTSAKPWEFRAGVALQLGVKVNLAIKQGEMGIQEIC